MRVAPWKTAADAFIFDGLTEEARAQYEWLLDSLYADIVDGVAKGRGLDADTVRALIDRAPLTGVEALAAHTMTEAGDGDAAFNAAKVATARFFADNVLATVKGLGDSVRSGVDVLFAVPVDQF